VVAPAAAAASRRQLQQALAAAGLLPQGRGLTQPADGHLLLFDVVVSGEDNLFAECVQPPRIRFKFVGVTVSLMHRAGCAVSSSALQRSKPFMHLLFMASQCLM
jgi:hypothetical protein